MTYALGRGLEKADRCAIEEICLRLKHDGYRMQTLIRGIVESTPFQKQQKQ